MMASNFWTSFVVFTAFAVVVALQVSGREVGMRHNKEGENSSVTARKAAAQVNGTEMPFEKKCRKMVLIMGKKQFKVFANCTKEVQAKYPNKDEFTRHFQCAIKCSMVAAKMVDENMTITAEGVQRFFDENVPTQYHEVGHKVMDKCVETWGPKLDPNDETCTAYGNFGKCMQDYVEKNCSEKTEGSSQGN